MVPEEKGSITLSKDAATIFATAKFKPFQNRIKITHKNKSIS